MPLSVTSLRMWVSFSILHRKPLESKCTFRSDCFCSRSTGSSQAFCRLQNNAKPIILTCEYWMLYNWYFLPNFFMSTNLAMSSTKMASWPCWTRSAWGQGQSQTRPSWTNWTPSVLNISTLRVASARIQSSSLTTACPTVASASNTMLARYWAQDVNRTIGDLHIKCNMFVKQHSATKRIEETLIWYR